MELVKIELEFMESGLIPMFRQLAEDNNLRYASLDVILGRMSRVGSIDVE